MDRQKQDELRKVIMDILNVILQDKDEELTEGQIQKVMTARGKGSSSPSKEEMAIGNLKDIPKDFIKWLLPKVQPLIQNINGIMETKQPNTLKLQRVLSVLESGNNLRNLLLLMNVTKPSTFLLFPAVSYALYSALKNHVQIETSVSEVIAEGKDKQDEQNIVLRLHIPKSHL